MKCPIPRSWRSNATLLALFVAVLVICSAGIWFLSSDARRAIDSLATANTDSTQWALAQTEVEYLRFYNALLQAAPESPETLDELRLRFDILYSRVQTFKNSRSYVPMRTNEAVIEAVSSLDAFLAEALPIIDSNDLELAKSLPDLRPRVASLHPEVRTMSLVGVTVFARSFDYYREQVARALADLALASVGLFTLLIVFVLALWSSILASRRKALDAIHAEARISAIAKTSPDGILVVDHDGIVLDFAGAAADIFGYSKEEAVGQNMADLIVPEFLRPAHEAGMHRYKTTGEKRVVDKGLVQIEAIDKSGRVFPVEYSISTSQGDSGEIFVSYIRDISERVAAEQELVVARDEALAGQRAKDELLALMSHEMRTPLNGILGTLQLLEETELSEKQKKYTHIMDASGKMLLHHVNNVLDISRADAGKIELSKEPFHLMETIRETADSQSSQATERGNLISVDELGDPIGFVCGDEYRIRQVLINLLGNANKFTKGGKISIEAERLPKSDIVEIRICDTGIGIAADQVDRIFEDFVTLDPTYTREVEGTGLGLGIVNRLIKSMNGEIGVESTPGEGSVFWVQIPLPQTNERPANATETETSPELAKNSISVLLVEDNEINRLVAREILASRGCDIQEAVDGLHALEEAANKKYDLIFMDISMPLLDGVAASRAIRDGDGLNTTTPIVALTAHALPTDIERFNRAGMNDVILKPIDKHRLDQLLAEFNNTTHLGKSKGSKGNRAAAQPIISHDLDGEIELPKELLERAYAEITDGITICLSSAAAAMNHRDLRARVHQISGVAAVTGLKDIRAELIIAEDAFARGDVQTATIALQRAADAFPE